MKSPFLLTESTFEETLTEGLTKKSFQKIGLYPVNREKYPKELFKEDLLAVYNLNKNLKAATAANQKAATPSKRTSVENAMTTTVTPPQPSTSSAAAAAPPPLPNMSFDEAMMDSMRTSTPIPNKGPNRRLPNPYGQCLTTDEWK